MMEDNLARKLSAAQQRAIAPPQTVIRKAPSIRKLRKRVQVMVSRRQLMLTMLVIAYVLIACVGLISMRLTIAEQNKQLIAEHKTLEELSMEHTRLNLEVEKISNLKSLETIAREQLGMVKQDKSQTNYVWIEKNNKIELAEAEASWYETIRQFLHRAKTYFVG